MWGPTREDCIAEAVRGLVESFAAISGTTYQHATEHHLGAGSDADLLNAIAERWIGGCRRELLDRTLIWNQAHLRRILCRHETHHNRHRPHRSLNSAAPLKPLPEPVDLDRYHVRRHACISGMINEYRLVA